MGPVSLKKVLHNKYGLRDYTNQALFVNSSNMQFAHYIAGLIEGDGTIHIPKSERSTKGNLNYPSIQIVFHLKDLPLALAFSPYPPLFFCVFFFFFLRIKTKKNYL
jgi:hypothetical protein